MDLRSLAEIHPVEAAYLAVREVWCGRTRTQVCKRIGRNSARFDIHFKKMLKQYPSVFYMRFGASRVYMDWEALPENVQTKIRAEMHFRLLHLGSRRDCKTNLIEVSPGPDYTRYIRCLGPVLGTDAARFEDVTG